MKTYLTFEFKGICPICQREMYDDGKSINRHHFIPKCRNGKEQHYVHTLCHNMIHSIWTEKELEKEFSDPNVISQHPEMENFINWIKNKDVLFYIKTKTNSKKKK